MSGRTARGNILSVCLLWVCALTLAGCAAPTPTPTPEPIELHLATVPHLSRLAQDLSQEFTRNYPYVAFRTRVMPARDATEAVANRDLHIALVAEPIRSSRDTLEATQIGERPLVLAVHPSNPINGLNWGQVRDIFSGNVWNWIDVDPRWEDDEIVVVSQHGGAVSRQVFEAHVMGSEPVTPRALVAAGDEVAGQLIGEEPAAIGYLLAGIAEDRLKVLAVNGITPDEASVRSGAWPITRPVNLVTHIDANVYVLDFLDFAQARHGRDR
ncbi:MAG: Phosphate-binding protein PstS 1 [Anaerolineales bacterium]|nr:Phosphate-binding protein PstS 1 [Anaerolineales bacterium]